MRLPVASLVLVACSAALASGCGLDSGGSGDLFDVQDGSVGASSDSGGIATFDGTTGGGSDSGHVSGDDAGVTLDAGGEDAAVPPPPPPPVDGCPSGVEICNNGIDDDCDGKIDCADPQCAPAAWQCTHAAIPQGWTLVEYANSPTVSSCGTGYTTAPNLYEGPFQAASCGCQCTVETPGTCESGSFSVLLSDPTQKCAGVATNEAAGNGACEPIALPGGYTPGANAKQQISPAPYTAGTCQPNGTTTRPPVTQNGHVCTETTTPGAGCANAGACVPAVQAGFGVCIQHAGNPPCPAGFPTLHNVGTGVTDARACSQCTCTGPTAQCTNSFLTLFEDAQCGSDAGTATIQVNGQCDTVNLSSNAGVNPTFHAYEYSATVTAESCGAGTSTPNGTVTLTGTTTICCQ